MGAHHRRAYRCNCFFEVIYSFLNYYSLGVDPAWRRHRQTARIRHGVARGFSTRTAHGNGRPHVFAPGGPGRVTLGPTLLPTTTRDATHHQTGEGRLPRMRPQSRRESFTHGVMSHAHTSSYARGPWAVGVSHGVTRLSWLLGHTTTTKATKNKAFAARQKLQ